MNLSSIVTSLELSRKLKLLGIKQESIFYWIKPYLNESLILSEKEEEVKKMGEHIVVPKDSINEYYYDFEYNILNSNGCGCCGVTIDISENFSAFTSSDLMQFIPTYITINEDNYYLNFHWSQKIHEDNKVIFFLNYKNTSNDILPRHILDYSILEDENEANARAKMLILLIENKIIEINKE